MLLQNELIVDASILFSFFKKDSIRRQLTKDLLNKNCKLISPYFILEELRSEKDKILKFSKVSIGEFEFTLSTLKDEIELILKEEYQEFLTEAKKLSPHDKDAPYFALSLSLNNCPIWSDEKAFKEQSKIKIFSTKELLEKV